MNLDDKARMARIGLDILDFAVMLTVILLLLFGGYSLFDNWNTAHQGFSPSLMQYKPDDEGSLSFNQLMSVNPDVIGWITIDQTHIDQPMVQGSNDFEYLNRNAKKEFSLSGAIFLSCENSPDFSDHYNLTYGHHMDNGGMYGDLIHFLDQDYFDDHTTGLLTTKDGKYNLELFAVLDTDSGNQAVYSPVQYQQDASQLIQYLKDNATHFRDVDPSSSVLAMSTCYDAVSNGRVIVFATMEKE